MNRATTYLNRIDDNFCIKLPFLLNEQQKEVIREIDKFVHDPFERVMTISGWAGTGKTTLMEIVKGRYWQSGPNIHFAATTHKAAAVLRSKVNRKVTTVNSLFGIMIEVDLDADEFDISKKKRTYDTEKLTRGSLVIIDESSMLSEDNYKDVIRMCEDYNCKVIFVGDSAQLSPVNEDNISIVFRNDGVRSKQIIELTQVERTDEIPILNESEYVRTNGHFTYKSNMSENGGIRYISKPEQLVETIDTYIDGLKDNPNYFRVLAYTNKNVKKLNEIIRNKLGLSGLPNVGEPLMSYQNWNYIGNNQFLFVNSEAYKVEKVIGERDVELKNIVESYGGDMSIRVVDMEISDPLGKKIKIPFVDIIDNKDNIKCVEVICREKIETWRAYKSLDIKDTLNRAKCLNYINRLDEYLFVNDNVLDWSGNLLVAKVVDFGYVHTIHKSQGCTFENVLINDIDIQNNCHNDMVQKQLRYVAVTRAKKNVVILTNVNHD